MYNIVNKHNTFINTILSIIGIILAFIGILIAWNALYITIPEYKEFIERNKIPNMNGNWNFTFITDESSYKTYEGMKDQYDVFLIGVKDEYKGKGEKWESYGNYIPHELRNRIDFDIKIKNSIIYGFFDLYGSREVSGSIEAILSKDGKSFEGKFKTSAADSNGKVIGVKKI